MELRDKIRNAAVTSRPLEVPEWDATVALRSLTVEQKAELVGDGADITPRQALECLPRVLVSCVYDPETDAPLFTDEDNEWLKEQPAAVVERVAGEAMELSGLTPDAADEKKRDS